MAYYKKNNSALTKREKDIISCWKKGIFSQWKIAEELGVWQSSICRSIENMRNKNVEIHDFDPFLEELKIQRKKTIEENRRRWFEWKEREYGKK